MASQKAIAARITRGSRMYGYKLLAITILFATLTGAWMFRYEPIGNGMLHRNRLTGVICQAIDECWFNSAF